MPDESPTSPTSSQAEKTGGIDFSKIKNFKDWLTAAIGAGATALVPTVLLKGLAVAAAPFIADAMIAGVIMGATAYKAHRKSTEPLRFAHDYRKAIVRNLKKCKPNSAESRQLKSDLAETDRSIHEINMRRILFSVSTTLPPATPPAPVALPAPTPLPASVPPAQAT